MDIRPEVQGLIRHSRSLIDDSRARRVAVAERLLHSGREQLGNSAERLHASRLALRISEEILTSPVWQPGSNSSCGDGLAPGIR
jgi:hypothetical protein